jgi:hypothetical protein
MNDHNCTIKCKNYKGRSDTSIICSVGTYNLSSRKATNRYIRQRCCDERKCLSCLMIRGK